MAKVIESIREVGVADEDLQTVGFSISPIVDWDDKSPTRGQVVSYRVEDTLAIKADVTRAGAVLDAGVAPGANVGGNLSFGLRDESAAREQALKNAVAAARIRPE